MNDPLLCDHDCLAELASEPILRRGLAYFKEQRVLDLGWDARRIEAAVAGSNELMPYRVDLEVDDDGELTGMCSCPFAWEPFCKHMVATLLAYAARQPVSEAAMANAADAAVAERVRRGQTEVAVKAIDGNGWPAAFIASSVGSGAAWRVEIRSVTERLNTCTCPDFATNRLGTCKHVEAVLHRIRRRRGGAREPSRPMVHVDWTAGLALRLRRVSNASPGLAARLDTGFDASGAMRGELSDAFHRFTDALGGRDDVHISRSCTTARSWRRRPWPTLRNGAR